MAELDKNDDTLLDAVGVAFSRLRRRTQQAAVEPAVTPKDGTRNLVINLIDESQGTITVGEVAEQLGVSPSVGSRMVSDCIDEGLVRRVASQSDGRRICLALTDAGEAMRDVFRRQYRQAFEQITAEWDARERVELIRLLLKYSDSTDALSGHRSAEKSART